MVSSPTWNCGTAAGPAPRTGSGSRCHHKDTGLANLPLHGFDQNRIWCALVAMACEVTAWTQLLAFTTEDGSLQARRWEPKRLRLRLFSAGGRLIHSGRRWVLHYARHGAWTQLLLDGLDRLRGHRLRPTAAPG